MVALRRFSIFVENSGLREVARARGQLYRWHQMQLVLALRHTSQKSKMCMLIKARVLTQIL